MNLVKVERETTGGGDLTVRYYFDDGSILQECFGSSCYYRNEDCYIQGDADQYITHNYEFGTFHEHDFRFVYQPEAIITSKEPLIKCLGCDFYVSKEDVLSLVARQYRDSVK